MSAASSRGRRVRGELCPQPLRGTGKVEPVIGLVAVPDPPELPLAVLVRALLHAVVDQVDKLVGGVNRHPRVVTRYEELVRRQLDDQRGSGGLRIAGRRTDEPEL